MIIYQVKIGVNYPKLTLGEYVLELQSICKW